MKIKIKYFPGAKKLEKIEKGNWIDVYANVDVFLKVGESKKIPLGFAMELPENHEGWLAPRSSTWKNWGIIQPNSPAIIDTIYCGDEDEWNMLVHCLKPKNYEIIGSESFSEVVAGTWIRKGDKIGQFRIIESMPGFEFQEVEKLGNENRGGFGTTGTK